METVNRMKHTIRTQDSEGNNLQIEIRLSDDHKNGHNDFAITANGFKKGYWTAGNRDQWWLYGGCCHDEILKARPDLKIFVDLHLCDVNGAPMYATANGYYHLEEWRKDPKNEKKRTTAKEYIMATDKEIDLMFEACTEQTYFAFMLEKLGIPQRWKKLANEAIEILEKMTGQKFQDNSVKFQYAPLGEKLAEIEAKVKEGYYSQEKINERKTEKKEAARQKKFAELLADRDKDIKKATDEYNVKFAVLSAGLPLNNFIYYNHSNEGVFNWMNDQWHPMVTAEQLEEFTKAVDFSKLPSGIVFKLDTRKK